MSQAKCLAFLGFLIVVLPVSLFGAPRLVLPDNLFFYQPAASVFGPEAVWTNPAALSRYSNPSVLLLTDAEPSKFGTGWGIVGSSDRIASAFRSADLPDGKFREYLIGGGFALSREFHLGLSYRNIAEAPGQLNKQHLWTIGTVATGGNGKLAIGAVWSNLNRGSLDGERSQIEQRYSIGWRPLKDRITLAADAQFGTGERPSEAQIIYHAELIPTPGLLVSGAYQRDRSFQLGIRLNLLTYIFGSKSRFKTDGAHARTTLYAGISRTKQASLIKPRTRRLVVSLAGGSENPPAPLLGKRPLSFTETVLLLRRAAGDEQIADVIVDISSRYSFAQAQELRAALGKIRSAGKRLIAYLQTPSNLNYYIATICDTICIPPVSQLYLTGLRAELTFYGAALEKIGAKAELLRIGEHKSAPESFTDSASSPAGRAQLNRLIDELYAQFVEGIASGRGLDTFRTRSLIDNGPFTADDALAAGLVDKLVHRDTLLALLSPGRPVSSLAQYSADTMLVDRWQALPSIAVVVAEGEISGAATAPFGSQEERLSPGSVRRTLAQATRDAKPAGFVLRINSPGGDALSGESIHRALQTTTGTNACVVSMGGTAASGGYYIAMPGKTIFASPATITGSIGIFGGKVDLSGLYDKLHLSKELYTRGEFAGMLSWSRPWTAAEREKYFSQLSAFYDHFVSLVSESRKLAGDSVDALAQGKVWTGREAADNGLIDSLGGVADAIAYVAVQRKLTDYRVELYPKRRSFLSLPGLSLLEQLGRLFGRAESPVAAVVGYETDQPLLMTRLPFDLKVE